MIYRFKSKATSDLIMLGPQADQILSFMGKQPALQGVIEVDQMRAALDALIQAVVADDALRSMEAQPDHALKFDQDEDPDPKALEGVTLRQRAWPMVMMLKQALAEKKDIVWGV
jgi:hypothetical protein